MIDVLIQMIEMMRNVSSDVKRMNVSCQLDDDLYWKYLRCLCSLERLAAKVHPQWQPMNADLHLPDCESSCSISAVLTPTASTTNDENQFVVLAHSLIDAMERLKLAQCIAQAQL